MMAEWFEDEAFWESFYPFLFPDERFQIAEEEAEKILKLVDFKGHGVLDLCCGPGRHSIALAKKGLAFTGVDRSRFLLAKAIAQAEEQNVEVEWVEEDMRYFARREAFDLVLNMFTSFGYFDNKDDDLKVLQNIHQSLRPSGICLLDVGGKEWLAKVFQPTTTQEGPDGSLLVRRHEIFDDWTRIRNECILVKEGKAKSFRFHHTIYSAQELKDRLRQVGFQRITMFGDLEGSEYGTNARRLVAVGWK